MVCYLANSVCFAVTFVVAFVACYLFCLRSWLFCFGIVPRCALVNSVDFYLFVLLIMNIFVCVLCLLLDCFCLLLVLLCLRCYC